MNKPRPANPDVLMGGQDIVQLTRDDVAPLKELSLVAPRRRARICAHGASTDALHEMMIVLHRSSYVRPHRHVGKTESFHVAEGVADVVVFDDHGGVADVIRLGDYASGRTFFYRLNIAAFHTVLVRSSSLVIHETTNGPFNPADTEFAPWGPDDDDLDGRTEFLAGLESRVRRLV